MKTMYQPLKDSIDVIVSFFGLIILVPLYLIIAIIIYSYDHGPIFYCGQRVGLYGKMFRIFKFRTMVVDAEKTGVCSTVAHDPRITPIGWFLRRYKLDELPQLINIIRGEMSFVGPRPEVKKFTDMYSEKEKCILTMKPGLTDYASLWNYNQAELLAGSSDPDKDYCEKIRPTKIKYQLRYYHEMSFLTDVKIILCMLKQFIKQ